MDQAHDRLPINISTIINSVLRSDTQEDTHDTREDDTSEDTREDDTSEDTQKGNTSEGIKGVHDITLHQSQRCTCHNSPPITQVYVTSLSFQLDNLTHPHIRRRHLRSDRPHP